MPDNTTIRKFIRHPVDIPIQVTTGPDDEEDDESLDQTITNVGLGGLAFVSPTPLDVFSRVQINFPLFERDSSLTGNVAWCEQVDDGYEIGIEFDKGREAFRMRMIEQICHIEHYRREVFEREGRELSSREAAREWIAKFADDFPAL